MCHLAKQKTQGKFVEFISPRKGYLRETYKSQNINLVSPTPSIVLQLITYCGVSDLFTGECVQSLSFLKIRLLIVLKK